MDRHYILFCVVYIDIFMYDVQEKYSKIVRKICKKQRVNKLQK